MRQPIAANSGAVAATDAAIASRRVASPAATASPAHSARPVRAPSGRVSSLSSATRPAQQPAIAVLP